jgi:hypothetical protein
MSKIFSDFLIRIRVANIKTLVVWPLAIGLIFLIGGLVISEGIYSKSVPQAYVATIGTISAFTFSLSGLFQIYRREGPGIFGTIVRGMWPVLVGTIWVAFTWTLGLFLLYQLFLEIFRN